MQCIRIPRRWIKIRSTFIALHIATFGLVGVGHAEGARSSASADQVANGHATSATKVDPLVVTLPFARGVGGDLVPNQEALKELLADSARSPGALLVIRPAGEMDGFGRAISTDTPAASQGDSSESLGRPGLEEGSAALLGVIHALREASPECRVSVLGLPIERDPSADRAAAAESPYGELLDQLDAFVSTRGLLQTRSVGDEQGWLRGAMPSAVRLAKGRPILFRTPTGWQQRTLAIEPVREREAAGVAASADSISLPTADRSIRSQEATPPTAMETVAQGSAMGERDQTPSGADGGAQPFDPPASAGLPEGFEGIGGLNDPMASSTEPLRGAMLSDSGGEPIASDETVDTEDVSSDQKLPELGDEAVAGGAASSPNSFAILPRALRALAPLAIGGDLLVPREFPTPKGASTSTGSGSVATPRPASASSVASPQSGGVRNPGRSTISGAVSVGSSSGSAPPSNAAAATPSRIPSSNASPTLATGSRAPASNPPSATATGSGTPASNPSPSIAPTSNAPGASTPTQPAPPTAAPVATGSSSNGSGSPAPATPPAIDPVIPITPPASSGGAPSAPPPPSNPSQPAPPRDWSTLPANVGNEHSRIGSHGPGNNYFNSGVAFANLIYASAYDPESLVRGLRGQGKQFFGTDRFGDWSGPAYFTRDGWPYRNDAGPLSRSNPVQIVLCWTGRERMWSILGLRGGFETPPIPTVQTQTWGSTATYPDPAGIAGRTFSCKVTCYWEGQGIAVVGTNSIPTTPAVSTVEFTGPNGQGPFGDGPRTMKRSTVTLTSPGGLLAYIIESDPAGIDPLRNLIVLVSEVRDTATGEIVYDGFDHTTYGPFQLYPDWVESMRYCSHIRSLQNGYARNTPTAQQLIHEDTGLEYQWHQESHGSTHLLRTGWTRPTPSAPGFDRGFAAINRPTHVGFSNSLRAYIEICNQLDADLWWCHPAPTVFVGTRGPGSNITYARLRGQNASDPNQVGSILVDEDYVQGFAAEIEQHLKPGLKVYSEWVNEIWNASAPYLWATRYAWTAAMRAIAPVAYGGDDGLWFQSRTLGSPAIYAGTVLKSDANHAMAAFSAAAGAALAESIRAKFAATSDRQLVCVAAGQSNWPERSAYGLGQFWAAMPKLFKHLDAIAHAPYRDPILVWPHNSIASDQHLVETLATAEGAWDAYEAAGMLQPPSDPTSWWISGVRDNGANLNYGLFLYWKHLALDLPGAKYTAIRTPPSWPSNKRRWNLQLLTYEGGTHTLPGYHNSEYRDPVRALMYSVVMEPRNAMFHQRYLETLYIAGPKGTTRDPASASEEALYRPGMVPTGVIENGEPLHDRFTFLITTLEPSFRFGMFWSLQWWNGHQHAPPAIGARAFVEQSQ